MAEYGGHTTGEGQVEVFGGKAGKKHHGLPSTRMVLVAPMFLLPSLRISTPRSHNPSHNPDGIAPRM